MKEEINKQILDREREFISTNELPLSKVNELNLGRSIHNQIIKYKIYLIEHLLLLLYIFPFLSISYIINFLIEKKRNPFLFKYIG